MVLRERIQSARAKTIVLVLALIAAAAVALATAVVHVSAPTHAQNGMATPPSHVVGLGKEPDTQDAYRQSQLPPAPDPDYVCWECI